MPSDHPLHTLIGSILKRLDAPNTRVVLGNDCGGEQKVQLFCTDANSYATCLCHVDAAILWNGRVKVIIEIEESDIRPVHLCGKVFVSALASHFIDRNQKFPMADSVFFIQVIDTSGKREKSSKLPQCRLLEPSIQNLLRAANSPIRYDIFYGDVRLFNCHADQQELLDYIRHAIEH